jgi:protein TonB
MAGTLKLIKFCLLSLVIHGAVLGASSSLLTPAQISFQNSASESSLSLTFHKAADSLIEPERSKTLPPEESPDVVEHELPVQKTSALNPRGIQQIKKIEEHPPSPELPPVTKKPTQEHPARTAAESVGQSPRVQASAVTAPKPPYPLAARRRGIEGKVSLDVLIAPSGEVTSVEIVTSSGRDDFDQSAYATVLQHWKFSPAELNNMPIESRELIEIVFVLH